MSCKTFALGVTLFATLGCQPEARPRTAPSGAPPPVPSAPAPVPPAPPAALALVLDHAGTRLSVDPAVVVPLSADPSRGADATYKRSGPNDLYLTPLAAALAREKAAGHVAEPLQVLAEPDTPYRWLIEALFTAGQSEIGEFELCEKICGARWFTFHAPRPSEREAHSLDQPSLDLVALIVTDGIGIKASGGNVTPGCGGVGPGIAIPRKGAALDLAAFSSCVSKLRASNPAFAGEDRATLSANPNTPFREIVDVALALRGPDKSLFPRLSLAVPK